MKNSSISSNKLLVKKSKSDRIHKFNTRIDYVAKVQKSSAIRTIKHNVMKKSLSLPIISNSILMKKKSIILFALLALTVGSAKAQFMDLTQNLRDFNVGLNLGVVGYHFNGQIDKTYAGFGYGVSFSLLGVYIDFMYQSPEHRYGNKISPDMYYDHTALTINTGYKIPVFSWLSLTPLIGYSNETTGWTDCSTINIDETYSIYHDYDMENIYSHFNYGIGLSLKPIRWLEIGGVCTAHAVYGNISVNLMKVKD